MSVECFQQIAKEVFEHESEKLAEARLDTVSPAQYRDLIITKNLLPRTIASIVESYLGSNHRLNHIYHAWNNTHSNQKKIRLAYEREFIARINEIFQHLFSLNDSFAVVNKRQFVEEIVIETTALLEETAKEGVYRFVVTPYLGKNQDKKTTYTFTEMLKQFEKYYLGPFLSCTQRVEQLNDYPYELLSVLKSHLFQDFTHSLFCNAVMRLNRRLVALSLCELDHNVILEVGIDSFSIKSFVDYAFMQFNLASSANRTVDLKRERKTILALARNKILQGISSNQPSQSRNFKGSCLLM